MTDVGCFGTVFTLSSKQIQVLSNYTAVDFPAWRTTLGDFPLELTPSTLTGIPNHLSHTHGIERHLHRHQSSETIRVAHFYI